MGIVPSALLLLMLMPVLYLLQEEASKSISCCHALPVSTYTDTARSSATMPWWMSFDAINQEG